MEVPYTSGKALGYVAMWWALQVGVSWAWVGVPILTLATAREILTKFFMEVPITNGKVIGYSGVRGRWACHGREWTWQY